MFVSIENNTITGITAIEDKLECVGVVDFGLAYPLSWLEINISEATSHRLRQSIV